MIAVDKEIGGKAEETGLLGTVLASGLGYAP